MKLLSRLVLMGCTLVLFTTTATTTATSVAAAEAEPVSEEMDTSTANGADSKTDEDRMRNTGVVKSDLVKSDLVKSDLVKAAEEGTEEAAEQGAEGRTERVPKSVKNFIPTEEIDADKAIAFPVDI